jgi:hypothetical protein
VLPASGEQLSAVSVLNLIVPQHDTVPVGGDKTLGKKITPFLQADYPTTRENRNESPRIACG